MKAFQERERRDRSTVFDVCSRAFLAFKGLNANKAMSVIRRINGIS